MTARSRLLYMTQHGEVLPQAYQQAADFLADLDEDWARHIAATGACRHEAKPAREPFEALVRAIAYQQLHARAGDAILGRLLTLYPGERFPSPGQLLATDPEQQRACGFSTAKIATIRGIAQATLEGIVPTRAEALQLSDDALIDRLVALRARRDQIDWHGNSRLHVLEIAPGILRQLVVVTHADG